MGISQNIKDWIVLIVDDEPDNVSVANKVLAFNGAEVHIARDGVEGLDVLQQVNATFILLDLSMPQMDGWEMFKRTRANTAYQHIPVIALTAHAMAGDRDRILAAGFNGYIAKPFRIDSFLAEIRKCLTNFSSAV